MKVNKCVIIHYIDCIFWGKEVWNTESSINKNIQISKITKVLWSNSPAACWEQWPIFVITIWVVTLRQAGIFIKVKVGHSITASLKHTCNTHKRHAGTTCWTGIHITAESWLSTCWDVLVDYLFYITCFLDYCPHMQNINITSYQS